MWFSTFQTTYYVDCIAQIICFFIYLYTENEKDKYTYNFETEWNGEG